MYVHCVNMLRLSLPSSSYSIIIPPEWLLGKLPIYDCSVKWQSCKLGCFVSLSLYFCHIAEEGPIFVLTFCFWSEDLSIISRIFFSDAGITWEI